jgi:hypothetical protein
LSEQQIKCGAHRSVAELEVAITAYFKIRNAASKSVFPISRYWRKELASGDGVPQANMIARKPL